MTEIITKILTDPTLTLILLFFSGIILFVVISLFVIAYFQGRELSFWPPKIGMKGSPDRILSPSLYGIQIIGFYDKGDGKFEVKGTYKRKIPREYSACLFNILRKEGNWEYWPKIKEITFEENQTWSCTISKFANNSKIQVFLIRKDGSEKLINYHLYVGFEFNKALESGRQKKDCWYGIKELPDDIIPCSNSWNVTRNHN